MLGHWAALLPQSATSSTSPTDANALGIWALQFTPRVALLEDSAVAEVSGSARLFGGMEQLCAQMESGAEELCAHLAWAPTATSALALARSAATPAQRNGFRLPLSKILDPLPLASVTAINAHQATLARVGCRTLGDVRQLPRGGLGRRFDKGLLSALDQAYGLRPEVHQWITVPETFSARLELMSRVDTAPALLFGARRLLLQMGGWLIARRLGVTAFTLRWAHDVMRAKDAGTGGEITVRTAQPTQSIEHCARLLSEHLAKVTLAAPAGDIELLAAEVLPIVEESRSLIPETLRRGADTDLALERIQARLGEESVCRPVLSADHRLEWMQSWECDLAKRVARAPSPYQLPLPSWVLDEPLRLVERDNRPHYQGPLQLLLGPDRVEGGWWHRSGDGEDAKPLNAQRDYWLALSPHAGLLWVFQQRLALDQTAWFLHGHFA
ncbi:DNA polymerase Y family protein [Acidovorax sp. sic0104]|uniref:Y-family DNA polymerase n=1 Tax=Acidovorax sp. sic0104 TaxID=2854784 RepID=UPI001C44CE31|nr:DNA polymerase Y family protein [Acidovorax sp. sic0104]MBV7542083.1 DNA polymerase Y family protein [Acidovorax sp. sic0104]